MDKAETAFTGFTDFLFFWILTSEFWILLYAPSCMAAADSCA
jgi:hypothetical protein